MIDELIYDNIRWECDKVKLDEDNDQATSTKPVSPAAKQELV